TTMSERPVGGGRSASSCSREALTHADCIGIGNGGQGGRRTLPATCAIDTYGGKLMAAEPTQVLAEFAASLSYDDLPKSAREHTKNVLLDTLACALAGHQGEGTGQVAALSAALGQSHAASGLGGEDLSPAG